MVVRNWGALIALVGAMLDLRSAHAARCVPLPCPVAGDKQGAFSSQIWCSIPWRCFLGYQAGIAVFVDWLWVVVFASYLPDGVARTLMGGFDDRRRPSERMMTSGPPGRSSMDDVSVQSVIASDVDACGG